jgi:exonuclease III
MFDIICLNETWLGDTTKSQDISLKGYQPPIRKDRKENNFGGIMIYVRNSIPFIRRKDLELEQIESIWVESEIYKKKNIIGTFYRPPNAIATMWEYIAYSIEKAKDTEITNVIETGDFNDNQQN